jgi:hypothetical protein
MTRSYTYCSQKRLLRILDELSAWLEGKWGASHALQT